MLISGIYFATLTYSVLFFVIAVICGINGMSRMIDNSYQSLDHAIGIKRFKLGAILLGTVALSSGISYATAPTVNYDAPVTFGVAYHDCIQTSQGTDRKVSPQLQKSCFIMANALVEQTKAK